ncbi:Translocase of chloroplast 132, chloroplastic-like protein [Drosera capensis]
MICIPSHTSISRPFWHFPLNKYQLSFYCSIISNGKIAIFTPPPLVTHHSSPHSPLSLYNTAEAQPHQISSLSIFAISTTPRPFLSPRFQVFVRWMIGMENGAVVAAGPVEKVVAGGLHRANQLEGDDVFEEAIDEGFFDEADAGSGSVELDSVAVEECVGSSGLDESIGHGNEGVDVVEAPAHGVVEGVEKMVESGVGSEEDIIGDFLGVVVGLRGNKKEGVELEDNDVLDEKTVEEDSVADKGGTVREEDGVHTHSEEAEKEATEDDVEEGRVDVLDGSVPADGKEDVEEPPVEVLKMARAVASKEDTVKEIEALGDESPSSKVQEPSCVKSTLDTTDAPVEEVEAVVNGNHMNDKEIDGPEDTGFSHEVNGLVNVHDNSHMKQLDYAANGKFSTQGEDEGNGTIEKLDDGANDVLKDAGGESLQISARAQQSVGCDSNNKVHDSVVVGEARQFDGPLVFFNHVGESCTNQCDASDVISSHDSSDLGRALKENTAGDRKDDVLCQKSLAGKHNLDDDEKVPNCEDGSLLADNFVATSSGKLENASVVTSPEDQGASAVNDSVDERFVPEFRDISQDSAMTKGVDLESVTSSSKKGKNSSYQQVSACEDDGIRDYHVIEEQARDRETVNERKQNSQSVEEVKVSTPPASNASSDKPASPVPPHVRPGELGRGAPLLESAPRTVQQRRSNGSVTQVQAQVVEEVLDGDAEDGDETREKLQMIRVKFLRLAHRLGQTPHNVVVAQVLYRLGLAEQLRGRNSGRVGTFTFDRASAMAEQLETTGQEPLDFSCTLLVLGKTGVGKSATINSIFDEVKFDTDAFEVGTKRVQDVVGTVQGIEVKVIDTPGLLTSWSDQHQNMKILHSVKRFIAKTPPDIVLYLDRLDTQSRDLSDMPLLRTITEVFGASIWFNAIVVLTHAASAPPEGPNGTTSTYDMFVTQRSHAVQQAIRLAAGDIRLMNPISLVENHSTCRTNRTGQRVLPNGQVWKPHLLLLSFASKILTEANVLLKLQDGPPGRRFSARSRAPPLPVLLSSLLQSKPQLKLPQEQFGDDDDVADDDLDESSDSEDESAYDELPPFRPLKKAELAKLSKVEKKAYFDELEYREKLFMKKQLKDEKKRRRMMKQIAESSSDVPDYSEENVAEENGGAATVPVAMPDLALPASFDSDNPTHRYRFLDTSNPWLVRPVLDPPGWDHDVGYEGVNVERLFALKNKIPLSFSGQISKDKKDINLQVEVASSIKHGEGNSTMLALDMQSAGKDMAYTLRSETRFHNHTRNKATAGLSFTVLGNLITAGMKFEDKLAVRKRLRLVLSAGALASRNDVAFGGSLEGTLRDKDHPLGRSLTTVGLSVMDWQGELATGFNLQSQIPIGRSTNLIGRVNLNNKRNGQVSIRLNSSEHLQLVLVGLIPLIRKLIVQPEQY